MTSFLDTSGHGFFDKVAARAADVNSLLCVGLDPHIQELGEVTTAAGASAFCRRLIAATSKYAVAYKPNVAFFEVFGAEGIAALKEVIAAIPETIPVLLDAKRGDIGSTAAAYASAAFEELGAHAITLNAYMGFDTVKPFLGDPSRGVFVLCKTSNESSNELQTLSIAGSGKALFEEVASLCRGWNTDNNVGLVVGATDVDALRRARVEAPGLWILAPGIGSQGGDLEAACSAALDSRAAGLIFPVSRAISQSEDPAAKAAHYRDRINAARKIFMERGEAREESDSEQKRESDSEQKRESDSEQKREPDSEQKRESDSEQKRESDSNMPHQQEPFEFPQQEVLPYQRQFIEFALHHEVLRFEKTTLKSERESPYFFNTGFFSTGASLARLAKFYCVAIMNAQPALDFDVVFGPAYKGISIGAAVAITLAEHLDRDVGFAHNRKEIKDHGEGGLVVGADLEGKRVLLIDDVMTAGTAIREAMDILRAEGAVPAGVVIALDRQERTGAVPEGAEATDGRSAVQEVTETYHIPVVSIVGLSHVIEFISSWSEFGGADAQALEDLRAYRAQYGVKIGR